MTQPNVDVEVNVEPAAETVTEPATVIVPENSGNTEVLIDHAERLTQLEERNRQLEIELADARAAANTATATAEVASEIALDAAQEAASEPEVIAEPEPEPEPVKDEEPHREHPWHKPIF